MLFAAKWPQAKKTQIDRMSVRFAAGKAAEGAPTKGKAAQGRLDQLAAFPQR